LESEDGDEERDEEEEDHEEEEMEEADQEQPFTEDEEAIVAYLRDDEPLPPDLLQKLLSEWWHQEPFRYTGEVPNFCTFSWPQKQLTMGNFDGVLVSGVQIKRHNFRQWESFHGLVDIPRMCLLCVSLVRDVQFGRFEPPKRQF